MSNPITNHIFKCKTLEGYLFKILSELLKNILIKTACFNISNNTIHLLQPDSQCKILAEITLEKQYFHLFDKQQEENFFFGVNTSHLHKMLRSVKKKDIVEFIIDNQYFIINITPKDQNRVTMSSLKIQSMQNLAITVPTGYTSPILVSSIEFQKMCKEMSTIGNEIKIICNCNTKTSYIRFCCDGGSIFSREVLFGEKQDFLDETKNNIEASYCDVFYTDTIAKILKIAGMNQVVQIFVGVNLPLMLRAHVGNLGIISIYIKSKSQIEIEECNECVS